MPEHQKVPLGPLPKQEEDYSRYEQTEILWGRILLLFALVFAAAFAVIYVLFQPVNSAPTVVSIIEQRKSLESPVASKTPTTLSTVQADASTDPQPGAVVASLELVMEDTDTKRGPIKEVFTPESDVDQPEMLARQRAQSVQASSVRADSVQTAPDAITVTPVTTLHPSIRSAILARDIDAKKQPIDPLSYNVDMQGQDLIKVVLHTDLHELNGQTLYHEWHLGDKRHARVKIPVNHDQQLSYSSKFIDKHMTGEWLVQIKDESGELYATANFVVYQ